MDKLALPPDQAGYAATEGADVLSVQLDGGASRYRRDILNAAEIVNVQWTTNASGYQYLTAFKRLNRGEAFLIDLYLDTATLEEYTAHFVPSSFRLSEQKGETFVVVASLEVTPLPGNDDLDATVVILYGGGTILELLSELVNVDYPGSHE